jgi:hypothetical protein
MKSKFTLLLALCTAGLLAADPAPARVSVRLKFMAWDDALLGYGVRIEGKVVPVSILVDQLSDEVAYEGPAKIEVVRIAANEPPAESQPTQPTSGKIRTPRQSAKPSPSSQPNGETPVAWIVLPATANNQHLILAVAPGRWEGGILPIPDSPGNFPPGSLRFFNLCPYPLEVRIGQNTVKIPLKEARSIRGGAKDHDYFDGAIMTYEGGEEKVGFSLHMFQDNAQRSLFFVGPGPEGSGTVVLKGVGDLTREKLVAPKRIGPAVRK